MIVTFMTNKYPREKINKHPMIVGSPVVLNDAYNAEYRRFSVSMSSSAVPDEANYCYVQGSADKLGGYYFIDAKQRTVGGLCNITLIKDVLSTLLGTVVSGPCTVSEHITGNRYVDNGTFQTEVREEIEQIDFPLESFEEQGEYILITAGGY